MTNATVVKTLVPGKLKVCTYGGFAPVCYKDQADTLIGLDVSFLTLFAKSLGLEIVTLERPFDGIWKRPAENECDVAGAGITQRTDRPVVPPDPKDPTWSPPGRGTWSDWYFTVSRSLLVRAAEAKQFDDYKKLSGKTIVVTRGSTADIDAQTRYPNCTIQFVDKVAEHQPNPQEYVVKTLLLGGQIDAFAEGDVSNQYLSETYGQGKLTLADLHQISGKEQDRETFNFIVRDKSSGLLKELNAFIAAHKADYNKK